MIITIFDLAHEITFAGYALFAAMIAVRGARSWLWALLLAAITATALWAQLRVAVLYGFAPVWLDALGNGVRDAAWLGLCLGLIQRGTGRSNVWRGLVALSVALIVLELAFDLSQIDAGAIAGVHIDGTLIRVAVTILGLVLVENIFRNSSTAEFWSLKHLLIGLLCLSASNCFLAFPNF